ncbi:hypothetical protein [Thermus tengchongensis]|uniref:hypothetical protein n=1 Tax=Thermus tengchongensis TaxID=1214928 RepID=UPI00056F8D38|nr:hypothetical protein [Thermus tengchongensis]
MRSVSKAGLLLLLGLLAGCGEFAQEFQTPARLQVVGAKEGACLTVKVQDQAQTRCEGDTFRFRGLSGEYPVEVVAEWRGLPVQGFEGRVRLQSGATARVEVVRKTLSLEVEAPWAGSGAVYEAWVEGDWAFGVSAYPDSPPGGLEGMVLVARGGPSLKVPTAPKAAVRVRDGAAEARVVVDSPTEGLRVRVPSPQYAPIRLTPEGLASGTACVAAFLGEVEAARSCTPPFTLSLVPPDGSYRTVLVRSYRDGLAYQEGEVSAKAGESRAVPMARKRVRVELTAPGFTVDTAAYGEVWLRPEDQEGTPLYGDPSPPGYPGYRLADRAMVVNGTAELSAPTGRMVLFRLVGARTTEGVVDLLEGERRVVLP